MRAGRLDQWVSIEQRSGGRNALGEVELTDWLVVVATWAQVRPLSSRELLAAESLQSEIAYEVTIRYEPGLTGEMRVRWHAADGERLLAVSGPPRPDPKSRQLVLMCSEGLTDGR